MVTTQQKAALAVLAAAVVAALAPAACAPPPKPTSAQVVHLPKMPSTAAATSASAAQLDPPSGRRSLDREKLALAEQMVDRAFLATDEAERRGAFDAALAAYEEATGEKARAVALKAIRVVMVNDASVVVEGRLEPDETSYAVAVRLAPPEKSKGRPRGRPLRLLGSGKHLPDASASDGGAVIINDDGAGTLYSKLDAEGRALPGGRRYDIGSGAIVISAEGSVELVDTAAGSPLLVKTPVTLSKEAINAAVLLSNRRYWVACSPPGLSPSGAVVIDTDERRVTINEPTASVCAVDADGRQLLVVRPPSGGASNPTLELFPFDGQAPSRITLGKLGASERPTVAVVKRPRAALVTFEKDALIDLDTRQIAAGPLKAPLVGPRSLAAVPVGSAGMDMSAVAPLASLARPPRRVVKPYYVKSQVWAENGLKSFDGKTAAVYTEIPGKDDSPVELVIADTSPLKARHRIELNPGASWRTAFFLDNRFLVAQQFPQYEVYDATSGSLVASPAFDECAGASPVFGHYLPCASALWDLTSGPGSEGVEGLVDLGLSRDRWWKGKDGLRELEIHKGDPGELRFLSGGKVLIRELAAPTWLHCRFGEWIAPFEVCERRALDAGSAPL